MQIVDEQNPSTDAKLQTDAQLVEALVVQPSGLFGLRALVQSVPRDDRHTRTARQSAHLPTVVPLAVAVGRGRRVLTKVHQHGRVLEGLPFAERKEGAFPFAELEIIRFGQRHISHFVQKLHEALSTITVGHRF